MNGSCAGGTGAFIDQMATLLGVTPTEMNEAAEKAERTYTIASRCGVFAKTDVQPLLNQGAAQARMWRARIFMAVVNQTIAGLAQGRPIEGNVVYLGGPLTFMSELRACFDEALHLTGVCPENSLYFVALGAALPALRARTAQRMSGSHRSVPQHGELQRSAAALSRMRTSWLLSARATPKRSVKRRRSGDVHRRRVSGHRLRLAPPSNPCVISTDGELLLTRYQSNSGDPVPHVRSFLTDLRTEHPDSDRPRGRGHGLRRGSDSQRVRRGFRPGRNRGAFYRRAQRFMPNVDFIIDIGGQDIKCFKIHNGAIDNIFLNEACSSGCGSFLQTFASALGYSIEDFAQLGLLRRASRSISARRCTVFMNSSVKQAQKDGAAVERYFRRAVHLASLRTRFTRSSARSGPQELGRHIVVQGGTFLNDAVLRAFEKELGVDVDATGYRGADGRLRRGAARQRTARAASGRKHRAQP